MCDCNIRFLIEGTKKLNDEYEDMIKYKRGDYFYITCSCGNWEEYFHKNFICCSNCNKYYCDKCNKDLVYDIQKDTCNCGGTIYYRCFNHYFCDKCKLPDCYRCDNDTKDKGCPICYKRTTWKQKPICETHYEIKQITHG